MLRKISIMIITFLLVILNINTLVNAETVNLDTFTGREKVYDVNSNYYSKVDSKELVTNPDYEAIIASDKYTLMANNGGYKLYVNKQKFNIAVLTKEGYLFYSDPQYYGYKFWLNMEDGSEMGNQTMVRNGQYSYSFTPPVGNSTLINDAPVITYEMIANGFKANFNFTMIGITLNVYVTLDGNKLKVNVPTSEIKEEGYLHKYSGIEKNADGSNKKDENGMPIKYNGEIRRMYYLQAYQFFPSFGATGSGNASTNGPEFNNVCNGYVLIPDGSGALMRYQYQTTYSTTFSKRVYGTDYGISDGSILTGHLKDQKVLSIPLFGVSHGYNQHAFYCVITEGAGSAELFIEPYGSGMSIRNDNDPTKAHLTQTAYFKYYVREKYNVTLATSETGTTSILPSEKYNNDVTFEYNFLADDNANYSGIAKDYRNEYLELEQTVSSNNIPLGLNVIGLEYKNGLLFKNFVPMTTYSELLNIVKDLENGGVKDFSINYKGYNRFGYYNNTLYKPKASLYLGGTYQYNKLKNYLDSKGYDLEACIDILTSYNNMDSNVCKKFNLNTFTKSSESTLFEQTYLRTVAGQVQDKILKYNKYYDKMGLETINLGDYSSNIYSYRYRSSNYSRSMAISQAESELASLDDRYNVSMINANDFAFSYISKNYESATSSSLYTYMTDSVPFTSLVLSGYIELFSEEINFVPDYNQYVLRLIEYNIYPYFTITNQDSSKLRYTNSENVYTSEYSLWEKEIKLFYSYANSALSSVVGKEMVSHEYVLPGVAKVTYSNGKVIYVNHNNEARTVDGVKIDKLSFEVR